MRGNKTTLSDAGKKIYKILQKNNITDISFGIIIQVKNRRDHRITIKHKEESGCHLLSITGKYYKQELRIYNPISKKELLSILQENKNENIRIL